MSEILRWGALETVAQLRQGHVSAVEVTQAHLARLEAVNPQLNAVVEAVPEALATARAIDNGVQPKGLLAGAPVTVKINADMAGYANSNGLKGLAGMICPQDSAVVGNLKAAGAVIVGRTNTPEMSLRWCTSNPLHGTTLNPWDAGITPGGSSGGAASSIASGIGVIAHGNDLGGSVRYPAFCCGVAGLKPSRGRIPAHNPSAPMDRPEMTMALSVQGPLARSAADLQLGLDAMRSFHPGDANWTAAPGNGRQRRPGPVRLGLVTDGFPTPTHPALQEAVSRLGAAGQAQGMDVRPVDLPEPARCAEIWGQLLFTETQTISAELVDREASDELKLWMSVFMGMYECLDLDGYIRAMAERARLQRAWAGLWDEVDFLVLPTSLIPPFQNNLDVLDIEKAPALIHAQAPLYVVNLLGLPALALPTHLHDGLPVGAQIVGPMHDDDAIVAAAILIEDALGTILAEIPAPFSLA